jgi:hypothetical protein
MSTITPSSGRDAGALLQQADRAEARSNSADAAQPTASGATAGSDTSAVVLDLSERAKMIMARAQADQLVADRPPSSVSSTRAGGSNAAALSHGPDLSGAYRRLAGSSSQANAPAGGQGGATLGGTWGETPVSDADFAAKYQDQIVWTANALDKHLPADRAQALRTALANGTLKFQSASDVADLNTQTSVAYAIGGGKGLSVAVSSHPTGAVKEAIDQGNAFVFWTADRGDVYVTW